MPPVLQGYYDANWISDTIDTKSMSGYIFTLSRGAISWKSTKQTYEAHSIMEVKFISLEKVGVEAEWLRNLIADIPL